MTREEFAACKAVLSAGTGATIQGDQLATWFQLLAHHEPRALMDGVQRLILERQYPGLPPLGTVNEYAMQAAHGIGMTAEEAFSRVRQAISRYGYYDTASMTKFVGTEIFRVVDGIGGWGRICDSPEEQRAALFAQFRDGWMRQEQRREDMLRVPEHMRPPPRIPERREPHAAVKHLTHTIEGRTNEGSDAHH